MYSVYAIRFTTPRDERSETIHVLRVAIASDSATPAVTLNSQAVSPGDERRKVVSRGRR